MCLTDHCHKYCQVFKEILDNNKDHSKMTEGNDVTVGAAYNPKKRLLKNFIAEKGSAGSSIDRTEDEPYTPSPSSSRSFSPGLPPPLIPNDSSSLSQGLNHLHADSAFRKYRKESATIESLAQLSLASNLYPAALPAPQFFQNGYHNPIHYPALLHYNTLLHQATNPCLFSLQASPTSFPASLKKVQIRPEVYLERSSPSSSSEVSTSSASHQVLLAPESPVPAPSSSLANTTGRRRRRQDTLIPPGCPLTRRQIVDLAIDEFNQLIDEHRFTDVQKAQFRDLRRKGKNRIAARKSREKRLNNLDGLKRTQTSVTEELRVKENGMKIISKLCKLFKETQIGLENGRFFVSKDGKIVERYHQN